MFWTCGNEKNRYGETARIRLEGRHGEASEFAVSGNRPEERVMPFSQHHKREK